MAESAKRHIENSNIIKEIRASTDAAIRNKGASNKTLEIQIGQMSKVLQERGFGSLPKSTETNPRDQVKSISTAKADFSEIRRIKYGPYADKDEGKSHARTLIDIPVFVGSFSIITGFTIIDSDDITKDVVLGMKFCKKTLDETMIRNGPVSITTDTSGQIKVLPPRTAEEIRWGWPTNLYLVGNDESKKMQKYILKQQFEGFSISNTEGLHKGYDSVNKKTGRKLQFDAKEPVGFDKTKVECYNCHKTGILLESVDSRELKITGGEMHGILETRGSITGQKEDSKALVTNEGEVQNTRELVSELLSMNLMKKCQPNVWSDAPILEAYRSTRQTQAQTAWAHDYKQGHLAEFQDFNGVALLILENFIIFNLFSVSKCEKKNKFCSTDSECLVLSPEFKLPDENQVLLKIPRQNNMYSFNLENIVPSGGLACLIAKATTDESNKWHRRLGHVNFKNLNKLVKGNLERSIPSKLFQNDHTCVACQKGKQHKASCKAKVVSSISHSLQLLHMDLFGPTSVRSLNHKTYCLVITDDFSRFSWVFFLRTKDETSAILKDFIRQIENQLNLKVKTIRSDNGTEFKNKDVIEFCGSKGIKREYSNARTPQQNGVAERKNRTLI
ncbi:putative ribonuclease H-like domain-containing protein [Tanacetum coccineum]